MCDMLLGNDVRLRLYGDPTFLCGFFPGEKIAVCSRLYVVFLERMGYVSVVIIF